MASATAGHCAPVACHAVAQAVDAVPRDAPLLVHPLRHALVQGLQRTQRVGLDLLVCEGE